MMSIRLLCLSILLLVAGCTTVSAEHADSAKRPNFLIILVDDMGMADIGSFGSEIPTPNIDKLALGGLRLTDFHASPVCSTTRAMLLTGVDSHRAGLGNMVEELAPNQKGKPGYEGELNNRVVTLPEMLRDNGYHTYMTGKWHLGMSLEASPWARGFERSFAMLTGGASHWPDMRPVYSPDPDAKAPYRRDRDLLDALPENFQYSSQFYVDEMLGYLAEGRRDGKPFFAYLAFTAPHWPLQVPDAAVERFRGQYDAGYDVLHAERLARQKAMGLVARDGIGNPVPPGTPPWSELSDEERRTEARAMEIYAAMVAEIDRNIGRLIDALEQNGELDNTVIVFLSDNGAEGHTLDETWPADIFPEIRHNIDAANDFSYENMGKPRSYVLYGHGWGRAGSPAYRLYKSFTTEGGTRVPAIWYFRGMRAGEISDADLSVKDVAPTFLDLAGVEHPAPEYAGREIFPMSGISMLPVVRDNVAPSKDRVEAFEVLGKRSVRKGGWKIVDIPEPYGAGRWQLYDLTIDPAERHDLAEQEPEILAALVREWDRYASENGVIMPDWVSGY